MRNVKRLRPSPSLVISMIALFVSISGVAWAAATIGTNDIKNSAVTTKKLHNNAVATKKIKDNAVNGAKVKDDSLTGTDIDESTLGLVPNANHANSADTATTANSVTNGSVGASGLKGTYAAVSGGVTASPAGTLVSAEADCNAGDRVLGGGFAWQNDSTGFNTEYSTPDPLTNPNKWIVRASSALNNNTLFAWAVCLAS